MRVIAGWLGGRTFASPHSHRTHPMGDRVRGALFNTLGDIQGLSVFDPFAGSGAIAFEAVSRGAASVLMTENDRLAQRTLTENINALGVGKQVQLIQANCSSWSDNNPSRMFDLVIADPPYDDLQRAALHKLAGHLKPGGVYVLSWPGKLETPAFEAVELVEDKSYGDARLLFFRAG